MEFYLMSPVSAAELTTSESSQEAQLFVINLCASTSPMALTHPSDPELKRFNFFVTRTREDGRERFRLHMGYFASQESAEALLAAVRDIYPAAWAGPAPSSGGPTRRTRTVAEQPAAKSLAPAIALTPASTPTPTPAPAQTPVAMPPTVSAVAKATAPVAAAVDPVAPHSLDAMSNVGAVLAQLSDDGATAQAVRPPAIARAPQSVPTLQPTHRDAPPPAIARLPTPKTLSDAQTLKVLEMPVAAPVATIAPPPLLPVSRRAPAAKVAPDEDAHDDHVRVVTPEDTQTLRDIRLDIERNAPPCFAVQLVWSVTPIDIRNLPQLAVFDAYTLYNVEGNRQGRRWYGLRLGFFSDPSSATQVAYYVRSDYPAVVVVPVALKERERAKGGEAASAKGQVSPSAMKPELQTSIEKTGLEGFELLQDDRPAAPAKHDLDDAPAIEIADKPVPAPTPRMAPLKAGARPTGKRVVVRGRTPGASRVTPGASTPLEETLDILGASTLTLDESHEIINDSAVRTPATKKKGPGAGGRFARLLNRLGS
jgi:hypothetical protein